MRVAVYLMMQVDGVPLSTVMWTVEPIGTTVPPEGFWFSTSPGSVHVFWWETLGTRLLAVMRSVAALSDMPIRLGTTAVDGTQVTGTWSDVALMLDGGRVLANAETYAISRSRVGEPSLTEPVQVVPLLQPATFAPVVT